MAKAPVAAVDPPLIPEPPPRGLDAGKCKSCGADILWGETAAGKKAPLDAKPETRLVLNADAKLVQVHAYASHFITCPTADLHRDEKRTAPPVRAGLEPHPGGR